MKRFSQRSHLVTLNEINITPLLDLAFVLLIIFVITTPLLEKGLDLKLPIGNSPANQPPDKKNIRTVEISAQGQYVIHNVNNNRPIPLANLVNGLSQEFQANPNLVIFIRADRESRMKDFVALTDACTSRGISRYSIRTQPDEGKR
jgi:biopolymer transport protein ExbD